MASVPARPKIFHITHWRNLDGIVDSGSLWSDAKRIEIGLNCELVGMASIKRRRLRELSVTSHPNTMVGEYVPFYFCPRSVMLFLLYRGNNPELNYRDGQGEIVHLQADLRSVVQSLEANGTQWAFSDRNAGSRTAQFWTQLGDLDKVDWMAVAANDWRDMTVKEGKQAEFLVYESFPWTLVERIGVSNVAVCDQVRAALRGSPHQPAVSIERSWYYGGEAR
jgi:hypothetical protein